ncbi:MAG: dihydroneopterin aldolase [Bacteroidota bacterium]
MAKIALEGMEFYAYHGYYKEEQVLGGKYIVDVFMDVAVERAAVKDDLSQTVNYETIYLICKTSMKHSSKLIETVAERIALRLKHQFSNIKEMTIRVQKIQPPLGGPVAQAVIEVDGNFQKKCGRCSRPLLCYGDRTCWCMDTQLDQGTLDNLRLQFGRNCLCKQCIQYYLGEV